MKALVTGGAGFIGSNLVEMLLADSHEVVILDDVSSGYRENIAQGATFIEADVRDGEAVKRAAEGCAVIFHLAASVGNTRSIEHPLDDSAINVLGTLNVLEAARANGIPRIVLSSSAGIFGELKTLPIAEDHLQDPDSPYGVSKLAAEKMCLAYNKLYGMRNVCLRYFNVYGPHQRFDAYGNVIPIFAERILRNQPITIFGDGEQTRDFIHVRDVARANYAAGISPDAAGAFNLGSGARVSINELAARMAESANRDAVIEHAAPRPGDVRDSLADISAAKAAFGFSPSVELWDGVRGYLEWLAGDEVTLRRWAERAAI